MTGDPAKTSHPAYLDHVGMTRQYWRDIVLGVNDGLVSMLLLVAGVVGGGLDVRQVLLTAVAGAIAGAVSMAAGEYLATKSQDEVLTSELALEREHIARYRSVEVEQLRDMFRAMGVTEEQLDPAVEAFAGNDTALLNAMAALEFGVVDAERRSPTKAMVFSGLLFLLGSAPSVLPFLFVESTLTGLVWAGVFASTGLFVVGVAKTRVTRGRPLIAGLENLMIAGLGGAVAYGVGAFVGSSGAL